MVRNTIFLIFISLSLAGCSSQSGNMQIGTALYGYSLEDQREAMRTVAVNQEMPIGALPLGAIDASRCHRNTMDAEPTEELILTDLRILAYAKGADGIYNVKIYDESGLLKNCWYILNGTASMYRNEK